MSATRDRLADPPPGCDLLIVGGGILGLACARALIAREPDARVVLIEREPRLAAHQTTHSSGVIHAGLYYEPGSLKARLCVEGARQMYEFCAEHGIDARRCGKLVVALGEGELEALAELERRGRANGADLARVDREEIAEVEPHAVGIAALHSPETGVVDFGEVAAALADDVEAGGGTIALGCGAECVAEAGGAVTVRHGSGSLRASAALFCCGAWADGLATSAGAVGTTSGPRIIPFRGSYLELRPQRSELVRALIYPVPDPALPFLGVHLSRMADGRVLLGPTALLTASRDAERRMPGFAELGSVLGWPGTWRLARRWWRTGASELAHALSIRSLVATGARYVPELRASDLRRSWSGVRAQAVARDGTPLDDFEFSSTARTLHVRNAPSPAATASLALADLITDRLEALDVG